MDGQDLQDGRIEKRRFYHEDIGNKYMVEG